MTQTGIQEFQPLDPLNRRFADYWLSLPRRNLVPARADFDPSEVPELLPHMIMHELIDRRRSRLRLVGTALVERYGMDITGRDYLEFVPPERREIAMNGLLRAVEQPAGMRVLMNIRTSTGRACLAESFGLPLSQPEGRPPILLFHSIEIENYGHGIVDDGRLEHFGVSERTYIDIGNGVPESDPTEPMTAPQTGR